MIGSGIKFVMDIIHGYIEISPICVKIIDTPEFQRLRNIKQLGFVTFVYPSANHTRFEHCIGVSYLAGKMARHLLKSIEYTTLDKENWIKCAEVAGLCHDIGHGAFSHDFELLSKTSEKHEKLSVRRFDQMCINYAKIGECINEEERKIVKAMILPEEYQHIIKKYQDEEFMFQIVSNNENGIDVDKLDYLARDAFYLGQNKNFNYQQLISNAKVIKVNEKQNICYPRKLKEHVHQIYYLRRWNFTHAYQHRVVNCISLMFEDAVKEAKKNNILQFEDVVKEAKKHNILQLENAVKVAKKNILQFEDVVKEAKKHNILQFEDAVKEAKKNNILQLENAVKVAKKNILQFEDVVKEAKKHNILQFEDAVKVAKKNILQLNEMSTDVIYDHLREKSDLVKRIETRKLYAFLGGIPKSKLFSGFDGEKSDENAKRLFLQKFNDVNDIPSLEELRVRQHNYKYGEIAKRYFERIYFYTKNKPDKAKALTAAEINSLFAAAYADPTVFFYSTADRNFDKLKKKIEHFINEQNTAEPMDQ